MQNLLKHGGSALAGAVNAMLAESTTAAAFTAGMLTSDGRCKTLDATADGYVRAEGCIILRLDSDLDSSIGPGAILAGTFVNQVLILFLCPLGQLLEQATQRINLSKYRLLRYDLFTLLTAQ